VASFGGIEFISEKISIKVAFWPKRLVAVKAAPIEISNASLNKCSFSLTPSSCAANSQSYPFSAIIIQLGMIWMRAVMTLHIGTISSLVTMHITIARVIFCKRNFSA
jgi:hypothetical protein